MRTILQRQSWVWLAALAVLAAARQVPGAEGTVAKSDTSLEQGFRRPPPSARPWVYWFWLNGNVTKEGITADLEAMKRAGLGGALWMWGGGLGATTDKPVKLLSPEWWELMRHAIREADRLGLQFNITNGSGWSHSGGPWIKPEHSMRRLNLTQEFRLDGPARWEVGVDLTEPLVGVVAYPIPNRGRGSMLWAGPVLRASSAQRGFDVANVLDGGLNTRWISHGTGPGQGPSEDQPESITFSFEKPYEAAALLVVPFKDCGPQQCQLQASLDGKEFHTISRFEMAPETTKTVAFEPVSSRRFRLLITSSHPFRGQKGWNVQIAEIRLLQKGEKQPVLDVKEILASRSMVDLTGKVDARGHLVWNVPDGPWRVQVLRHRSTGDRPHPILGNEGGWECDKLSPEAVEENWKGFVLRILNECGPEARRVVRYVHVDSYEFRPSTWTAGLIDTFKKRCGYDPMPYLPVILGQVVDSPETSARFLWDFRRLMADLFAEGIGGRFRKLAESEGLDLTTEPHLFPGVFDQIQYGGHVSHTVGNFLDKRRTAWYGACPPVGPEMHLAKGEASAAYVYGLQGVVWAEAFTGVDHAHAWHETPDYLKTWGDLWLCEGINRFCFHCWPHSPWLDRKPGNTLGPWGIHFDRNNTWFEFSTGYLTYLARSQYLLQQGLPVMDACVLTGDGRVDQFPPHPELRANGYDYHGMTSEVLVKDLAFKDGWLVLPSGMRYRLLVTYDRNMLPQTLHKIKELVASGATVMGEKPDDAPGLAGFPESRAQVRTLADELWGTDFEAGCKGRRYGKGTVYWARAGKTDQSGKGGIRGPLLYLDCTSELDVLKAVPIAPDFAYARSGKEDGDNMLIYMHRRVKDTDLYFVSNQAARPRREDCTFRVAGRRPELWDAVTGEIRDLPVYREQAGRTTITLDFAAGQSFFVVFRQAAERTSVVTDRANTADMKPIVECAGPWEVSFERQWGGPEKPVTFAELQDWTNRPEAGIKYYSGKAVYRKSFDFPATPAAGRIFLDLGRVCDVAEVRLNGKTAGIVWCAPWRIDITGALRSGANELELVVVNQWVNRLIGDAGLPQEKRLTWTTWNPYQPTSPLLPSGLLGPVRVVKEE